MESSAVPAVIALSASIGCWLLILAGHPVWAFVLGVAGLLVGFAGVLSGVTLRSPTTVMNMMAVLISLVGVGVIGIMFGRIFL